MKITNIYQVDDFLAVVNKCKQAVYLKSGLNADFCLNLKSKLSQYVAIANMVGDQSDSLELFCSSIEDEAMFMDFFSRNPEILYA